MHNYVGTARVVRGSAYIITAAIDIARRAPPGRVARYLHKLMRCVCACLPRPVDTCTRLGYIYENYTFPGFVQQRLFTARIVDIAHHVTSTNMSTM